ncbi:MAG: S8 family serine peptidase [Cyclobacteriaceae bacterium]
MIFRFCIISFLLAGWLSGHAQADYSNLDLSKIRKDAIVVKIGDEEHASNRSNTLTRSRISSFLFAKSISPILKAENKKSVLSGIYKIQLRQGTDIPQTLQQLSQYANVIYAEPIYYAEALQIPDDPQAHPSSGSQYHLTNIQAYDAWDISTGSADIVIGISDTGIDFDHEDIATKIYTNPNEIPENGVDDDENGFIDDIHGYDFGDDNNDPQCTNSYHGNFVAGLAGAATNNGIGIAGVGYDCAISPLKIFPDGENLAYAAYEGIVYAADNGYNIVNLSYGNAGSFTQFNQDIIDYAVLEKDLVIIAAGGNSGIEENFYPASYDHVLSVGWTNYTDDRSPSSTYSYNIDLMAPGVGVYSSLDGGYSSASGSSYASPIVAGAAGLVKDVYPYLNAEQIMEVLRVTTDNIYDIGTNSDYEGKLGSGRLNIYNALTRDTLKSVRAREISYSAQYDDYVFFGDTVNLSFKLKSYLGAIDAGTLTLSSPSDYVTILNETLSFSFSDSMQTKAFDIHKSFVISPNAPPDTTIPIRMDFSDGEYQDFQYFTLETSPDYLTVYNEAMGLTLSGNGNLGYADNNFKNGSGFLWNDITLARSLGIIIANAKDSVSDNVTSNLSQLTRDEDLVSIDPIKFHSSELADSHTYASFQDSTAHALGIKIEQKSFAFSDSLLQDFIILEYRLTNLENDSIHDLSIGLFSDWQLADNNKNKALTDSETGIAYAYDEVDNHAGMKWYGINQPISQSIDLDDQGEAVSDLPNTINDSIKHKLISEALLDSAGFLEPTGNNIAQVSAIPKVELAPFESRKVAVILAAASSLADLKTVITRAESTYTEILESPPVSESFSSCNGASLAIDPTSGTNFRFFSDPLGQNLIAQNDTLFTGSISSDTSFYLQNIDSLYARDIQRIDISLVSKVAEFTMSTDTLYLDNPSLNMVSFEDQSFMPTTWAWDFGNGTLASAQNPEINFREAGTYEISLTVETEDGCIDTQTKLLTVATRPSAAILSDMEVCLSSPLTLADANDDTIKVYTSSDATSSIFQATQFEIDELDQDTTFYISRLESGFESLKTEVNITIQNPTVSFDYMTDTNSENNQILLINRTQNSVPVKWIVDGEVLGNTDSIPLGINKNNYEVKLIIATTLGCTDSLTRNLIFTASPKPTVSEYQPCFGESVTIAPANGLVFGFYRDMELTDLIEKGNTLTLQNIQNDTSIFVVGLDSALASEPVKVDIIPEIFDFTISASPEVLDLSIGKNATFTTNQSNQQSWSWFIDDQFIGSLEEIEIFLPDSGTYEVICVGESLLGCEYADTIIYEAFSEIKAPLTVDDSNKLRVFPNPTSGSLQIHNLSQTATAKVYTISGMLVISTTLSIDSNIIDFRGLEKGIYLLELNLGSTSEKFRVFKK